MRRRNLIALAGVLAIGSPGAAMAQPYRIGLLRGGSADYITDFFKSRLAELGYVEERDYVLKISAHYGRLERLPGLAAELIQDRPDVIVASGPEAVLKAVSSVTASIPISRPPRRSASPCPNRCSPAPAFLAIWGPALWAQLIPPRCAALPAEP